MDCYPLLSFIRLRKYDKDQAIVKFKTAQINLEEKNNNLERLKKDLLNTKQNRLKVKDSFINNLSLRQNQIIKETAILKKEEEIKIAIRLQEIEVESAKSKFNLAKDTAVKSHQELKTIERHFNLWQKDINKKAIKKENEENDEIGQIAFITQKKINEN